MTSVSPALMFRELALSSFNKSITILPLGVDYFVEKSGGYKRFADNESIYILHPNGETQRYSKQRNLFANQPNDLKMYPGSVIFVPRKIDNSATRRLATQAYVSILGNLGVALASLSAIDNN